MNYLLRIGTRLIIGLLFFQSFSQLQGTTISNYAEMSLALAAIPFDIAAQKHALANDTKKAASNHFCVNSINLLKNSLYLFNNFKFQSQMGRINLGSRDVLVHYALVLTDLKNLCKNLKKLLPARKQKISHQTASDDFLNFDFDDEEESIEQNIAEIISDETEVITETEIEQLSELVQRLRTIILPTLKGLTSFALACAQGGATPYESISRKQARYLASSAHLLTRLLAEYSVSQSASHYKKLLKAALILNSAWLAYEATQYVSTLPILNREPIDPEISNQEPFVPLERHDGLCTVCYEDAELLQLHCGHSICCQNCLNGHLNAHNLNTVSCPQIGCNQRINRNDFRGITDNDVERLAAYDEAHQPIKAITPEAAAVLGAKPCPGRGCGVPIYRYDGCQHMTCRMCNHEFCWICLGNYRGGPCSSFSCSRPVTFEI